MITGLKPYLAMKDSGVPWLGNVPEHWQVCRLRNLVEMRVSNVDKHIKEGEQPVRLCNYVDVYKNDYIRPSMRFMRATATKEEIERFRLLTGDVLITKDSEAWNDIGVPALVRDTAADLVSGYHLALLRPFRQRISGEYLLRALQSTAAQYQFHVEANGVTRYGLSHAAIKSVWLPAPPLPEQAAIVRFLDHADRRIRRYIRAKQKLIKLLEEQKQAIIHRAVTRGLDPNVRLKPSGVEWLGDVPEHWDVLPLCAIARPRKQTNQPHRELLSVYLGRGVIPFSAVEEKRTNPTSEDLSKYQVVEPGDFVLNNQQAWRGSVGVSRYQGIVSPAYLVLRLDGRLLVEFADRLLSGRAMVAQYLVSSKGVGSIQRNLYWPHLRRVAVLVPPAVEQAAIARYLNEATASLTTTIEREGHEIDLLREFRTRLITDVVTGKLDVREAAARLPDDAEEPEALDEIDDESQLDETGVDDIDEMTEEGEA